MSAPLERGRWLVELSGLRYRPYFDLSTLWGFFEPVSYSEVMMRVGWSPTSSLGAWVSGGWRTYGNTNTTVILEPLRDTGWRADAGARWQLGPQWAVDGRYELEWGPGGFLNSGDASVHYTPSSASHLADGAHVPADRGVPAGAGPGLRRERHGRLRLERPDVDHGGLLDDPPPRRRQRVHEPMEPGARMDAPEGDLGTDPASRIGGRSDEAPGARLLAVGVAVSAVGFLGSRDSVRGLQEQPFPHERHEGLFPLCTGAMRGFRRGTRRSTIPTRRRAPGATTGCAKCGSAGRALTSARTT